MKPRFRVILLIGFFATAILLRPSISWSGNAEGDSPPALTVSLDQDAVRVGGILRLSLRYRLPEGAHLPSDPKIEGLEDLNVLERHDGPDEISLKVLVDRLGSWKTGPIALNYVDKDGKTKSLKTDPVSVNVQSNLGGKPEEARLKPIQGILPTRPPWVEYLPWAMLVLGVLVAGAVVFFLYRRHRGKGQRGVPQDPPHILAKMAIEELLAQGYFEKGDVKAFYFRFSEILRRYLESIRGFPAAESTTEEIASRLVREQDRVLLPLLRQADLVKFADTVPTPARKEEEVETALSYIRETGPIPNEGQAPGARREADR